MFQRKFIAGILLAMSLLCSFSATAVESNSPIGIGLFPPLQVPNTEFGIKGLRLAGVGVNRSAAGLDIGLLGNVTYQSFKGTAVSLLFNYNKVGADIIGLQIAGLANVNGTGSSLYGLQIGLFNKVTNVRGIQIGLVNMTQNLRGIQIGLINFNHAGPFKVSPIINAAF